MAMYEVESKDYYMAGGNWCPSEGTYCWATIEASTPRQAAIRYAVRGDWPGGDEEMSEVTVHTRQGERVFEFTHAEMRRLQRRLGVRVSQAGRSRIE